MTPQCQTPKPMVACAARSETTATRARIVVLVSVATVLYFTIGMPVFNYYMPSGYWIYLAISQLAGFVVGGLVLARWFLPGEPRKL